MVVCPYCKKPAKLVTGREIYPLREDLRFKKIWHCKDCDARVGCHDGTNNPKGKMGNAEVRALRMQAHDAFDPLWKKTSKTRAEAYQWLAKKMGITTAKCHIGNFNKFECERVIKLCKDRV